MLEAGQYQLDRVKEKLGVLGSRLTYLHCAGLSRTKALNRIFNGSSGRVIIRLDARSRINDTYLQEIFKLSQSTGAENVGGIMLPIGSTRKQRIVASLMSSPLAFGGSKSRKNLLRDFRILYILELITVRNVNYCLAVIGLIASTIRLVKTQILTIESDKKGKNIH